MYTIETLIPLNSDYHANNAYRVDGGITQSVVDNVNKYVGVIEQSRIDNQIQPGDIVELTTEYGDYYRDAHVDKFDADAGTWNVCCHALPYVSLPDADENIRCNTGGGPWYCLPNDLKRIGKRKKLFRNYGFVQFEATVNVWEYKHPAPMHRDYTTKDFDKYYISYCADKSGNPKNMDGYRYIGYTSGIAFRTKEDYEAWRDTFKGVEFVGGNLNSWVVFTYKRIEKLIMEEEFNNLDLPVDTRVCNGIIQVKVKYNHDAHTVTEYRYTNSGGELRDANVKPYQLARGSGLSHL